jgi:hypothetical protein
VRPVRAAQRDSEVAVEPELDDHLVLGKPLPDAVRVRDHVRMADLGAGRSRQAILHRLGQARSLPARQEARPLAVLRDDLGHERDVGAKGAREVLRQALEELLADRPRCSFRDEPEQILPRDLCGRGAF